MTQEQRDGLLCDVGKLGRDISQLTRENKLWRSGGALSLSRKRYRLQKALGEEERIDGLCSLASSYYAAFGSAFARARLLLQSVSQISVLMVFRGLWYLGKALWHAVRFYRVKPVKDMSAGQLDVLASIFRTVYMYSLALSCIGEALHRPDIPDNDRVLLLIHKGEIKDANGRCHDTEDAYMQAEYIVLNNLQLKPSTCVRFLRSFAEHQRCAGQLGAAQETLAKALTLALENNLESQMIKIRVKLERLKD